MAREVKYDWFYGLDNMVFAPDDGKDYELRGYDGDDALLGNDGHDLLLGGNGDDTLWGGNGDDEMKGGDGDDLFLIDRGNDTYVGGTGSDTLSFAPPIIVTSYGTPATFAPGPSSVGFSFDVETGRTFAQTSTTSGYTDDWGTKTLSSGINAIEMTGKNDILRDSDLGRRLYGNDGNDIIEGRGGADLIDGGRGSDTTSYQSSAGSVNVLLTTNTGDGHDAAGDTYVSIENVIGSAFDDLIIGNHEDNVIEGGRGADNINGGTGGNDTAVYKNAGANEFGQGVIVDIQTGFGALNEASGDYLTNIDNLVGSAHNDVLRGNATANKLEGGAGIDQLLGRGGADILIGGAGSDTFVYRSVADSTLSAIDQILDFVRGIDKIDLSQITPDTTGNKTSQIDTFEFIGTSAFSGDIGELRAVRMVESDDEYMLVMGDTNGDRFADFAIEVHVTNPGLLQTLTASDFIL